MAKKKSRSRFWTVLTTINLLMLAYPICLLAGADSPDGTILGVVALCGAGLLLGVADIVSVLLAYSSSY